MFHEGTCLQNKKRQTIYSRNIAICHVKDRSKFFQPKKPIFLRARFARNKNHCIQPIFRLFQSHFRAFLAKKAYFSSGSLRSQQKSLYIAYFQTILGPFQGFFSQKSLFFLRARFARNKNHYIQPIFRLFQGFFGQKKLNVHQILSIFEILGKSVSGWQTLGTALLTAKQKNIDILKIFISKCPSRGTFFEVK